MTISANLVLFKFTFKLCVDIHSAVVFAFLTSLMVVQEVSVWTNLELLVQSWSLQVLHCDVAQFLLNLLG